MAHRSLLKSKSATSRCKTVKACDTPTKSSDLPDKLSGGNIAPGGALAGAVTFEAPMSDAKLELIFEKVGYRQATFELY
jgi:hypothetical protein